MGKTAKAVGRVIGYILVAAAVWLTTLDGVAARLAYDQHPQAVQRYSSTSKTAVVFFTGVQSSGRTHSAPLQGLWSQHGDVVVVQYNPHRFDGRVTAFDVRAQLVEWGYQRALLIGASMGGLLATDIIDLDRATGNRLSFAAVLVDTPQSEQDLYHADRAEAVALIAHPGPAGNLFSGWIWRYFFDPPPQYMLGSGVDQSLLAEHYRASSSYPLSGWSTQVRYIVQHRGFERNQYNGIPLVVMESEHDGVVKPTASKWQSVFGGGTVIKVPQTTHVGFVEYPDRWRAGFTQAFAALPGW